MLPLRFSGGCAETLSSLPRGRQKAHERPLRQLEGAAKVSFATLRNPREIVAWPFAKRQGRIVVSRGTNQDGPCAYCRASGVHDENDIEHILYLTSTLFLYCCT